MKHHYNLSKGEEFQAVQKLTPFSCRCVLNDEPHDIDILICRLTRLLAGMPVKMIVVFGEHERVIESSPLRMGV